MVFTINLPYAKVYCSVAIRSAFSPLIARAVSALSFALLFRATPAGKDRKMIGAEADAETDADAASAAVESVCSVVAGASAAAAKVYSPQRAESA
jgi:ribose/xylose/arabinose/galactoside ABC-type transport system permease subunit